MHDNLIIERLRPAIKQRHAMSSEEWFADMVRRGILDERGNVLIRMPEPPSNSNGGGEESGGTHREEPPSETSNDSPSESTSGEA